MITKPRPMTLDRLREKYRNAIAAATAAGVHITDEIRITYTSPEGLEQEISHVHLLDDAKCDPGRYRVLLDAPGCSFDGEAVLADPMATGAGAGGAQPMVEMGRFVSSLLKEGREQVSHTGDELKKAWARIQELEELTMTLMRTLRESARPGDSPLQRELVQTLGQAVGLYFGLGGPLNARRLQGACQLLQVCTRNPAVQDAIRTDPAGAAALREMLGES